MKRALAERAKQSIPERSPSAAATSSPPESQPPLKIARPSPSTVVPASTGSSRTPRSPNPVKTASAKRPREQNGNNSRSASQTQQASEESNVDETSAFYLKHQNRALATELKGWQQQCRELTSERDQRRRSCWSAVQALQSLQATWTTLETALGQSQPGVSPSSLEKTEAAAPPSTALVMGRKNEEDEVEMEDPALAIEWTGALHEALHNLAFPKKEAKNESSAGVGEDPHDVGELAANVASRANCLQDWLWKVLQAKRVSSGHLENLRSSEEDAASERERWQHQAMELTRSRDHWRSQERRLRRNLYRLEAGIVTMPHVMQNLERQDGTVDDDDMANKDAEIRASVQLEKAAQDPPPEEKQREDGDANTVSSAVVEKLQQQIQQLEQEKKRRDETIGEVRVEECVVSGASSCT